MRQSIPNRDHMRLVRYLAAKRFGYRHPDYDDIVGAGSVALTNALRLFDPSRGFTFGTYVGRAIHSEFTKFMAKRRKELRVWPVDMTGASFPHESRRVGDSIANQQLSLDLESAMCELPRRQRYCVRLHLMMGVQQCRLAPFFGITRERIRQVIVTGLKMLRVQLGGEGGYS